jgi:Protein of unknown function (DUF1573)
MVRRIGGMIAMLLVFAGQASAQQWATKMFSAVSHDFGAVPRSAKIEFAFPLTNLYRDDVHIAGVRSSCGCTLPRIEKETLKSWEKGSIIAEFNTRAFLGQHGAHVTVTIDQPQYAEVQLEVKGYIRTDVVVEPGQVAFGAIDEGSAAERKLSIEYSGGREWRILEVKPASSGLTATFKEKHRSPGRVSYDLLVKLAATAPTGYLREQLILVTNDNRSPELPVIVEGRVTPELTVSPSSLMLGLLQPGQTVTRQLVIRAKRPFRVTGLEADGGDFQFKSNSAEAKPVHLVPVTFTAGNQPGKIAQHIRVETDLGPRGVGQIEILGEVVAPLAGK